MRLLAGLAIAVACACGSSPASRPLAPSASSPPPAARASSSPADEARALRDKILRVNPHVIILKQTSTFTEYREVIHTVEGIEGVAAAEPFVFLALSMASTGHASIGVALKGVDPQGVGRVLDLGPMMKVGKLSDLAQRDPSGIILGDALAAALGVRTGDRVVVTTSPQPLPGQPPRDYPFRVVGIVHTDIDDYDERLALVALPAAQEILDRGDEVLGVEVKVKDVDRSEQVARAIERALEGPPYEVQDWFELNGHLFGGRRP